MIRTFLALILLSVVVGSCTVSKNLPPAPLNTEIIASAEVAKAGEFVQLTVTGGYALPENSEVEEVMVSGVVLGLCLIPSEEFVGSSNDFYETLSLPDGFAVADDEPLFIERSFTLKPGERVETSHTIQLTATEARGVTVVSYVGRLEENGEFSYIIPGVEEERAFIRFQ